MMLSKSLGNEPSFLIQRQTSQAEIAHAGYLLEFEVEAPIVVSPSTNMMMVEESIQSTLDAPTKEFANLFFGPSCTSLLDHQTTRKQYVRTSSVPVQPSSMMTFEQQWRPRYCVLEKGKLYFYKANNMEKNQFEHVIDLSQVSAVRSATTFAPHAFELILDDDDQTIILQAQNASEMSEWLFQFQRAITSFVKDFVDQALDLATTTTTSTTPPRASPINVAVSPRYYKPIATHGHGRVRRKRGDSVSSPAVAASPESPHFTIEVSSVVTPFAPEMPSGKYVPPQLRGKTYTPIRAQTPPTTPLLPDLKLGGCADPDLVDGSILDPRYIPRTASRLENGPSEASSCVAEGFNRRVEVGAYSHCGHRDSNEDSYFITADLSKAIGETCWEDIVMLVGLFDGHQGNHAARYAAEKLTEYIHSELVEANTGDDCTSPSFVEGILQRAIARLDDAFCQLCVEENREWDSGATALVAALVEDHLVVANVGDARGVFSRVADTELTLKLRQEGWLALPPRDRTKNDLDEHCLWKLVTEVHSPSKSSERDRIEDANGWVVEEKEIPAGQLKRIEFSDQTALDILSRSFKDKFSDFKAAAPQRIISIFRVCGDLSVSRAIGDRCFKAAYNDVNEHGTWSNKELFFAYPRDHDERFRGDLISSVPDMHRVRVGELGSTNEFLLLACDGLWDVMDEDDAVRVTLDLLSKGEDVKHVANRLAEIAYHLGSSDNITVIVVRFCKV